MVKSRRISKSNKGKRTLKRGGKRTLSNKKTQKRKSSGKNIRNKRGGLSQARGILALSPKVLEDLQEQQRRHAKMQEKCEKRRSMEVYGTASKATKLLSKMSSIPCPCCSQYRGTRTAPCHKWLSCPKGTQCCRMVNKCATEKKCEQMEKGKI